MAVFRQCLVMPLAVVLIGCGPGPDESTSASETPVVELQSLEQEFSYAAGYGIGKQLAEYKTIDLDAITAGLREAYEGVPARLSAERMREVKAQVERKLATVAAKLKQQQAKENLAEAEQFLLENADKENVATTESGLQYQTLREGEGVQPGPEDVVLVRYAGETLDGKPFDKSTGDGTRIALNQAVAGWSEGLQLMREGGKSRLFLPPDLAFGEAGFGQVVGPNEALIVEVELLKVLRAEPDESDES